MVDREPCTSSSNDLEFDEEFIRRARHLTMDQITKELELLESGDHPLLRTVKNQQERDQKKQTERISDHRKRQIQKVDDDYERKEAEIKREYEARLLVLQEEARKRSAEMEVTVNTEYSSMDINKPPPAPVLFDTNKKTLRGRGGGQLIEPANYFNSNQNSKIPEVHLKLAFDDDRIRRDLAAMNDEPDERRAPRFNVIITKPKLTIDGKSFKHGEEVTVKNSSNEAFQAKMEIASEQLIHFKAAKIYDIRSITATLDDLEDGRVTVAKKSA